MNQPLDWRSINSLGSVQHSKPGWWPKGYSTRIGKPSRESFRVFCSFRGDIFTNLTSVEQEYPFPHWGTSMSRGNPVLCTTVSKFTRLDCSVLYLSGEAIDLARTNRFPRWQVMETRKLGDDEVWISLTGAAIETWGGLLRIYHVPQLTLYSFGCFE